MDIYDIKTNKVHRKIGSIENLNLDGEDSSPIEINNTLANQSY